MKTIKITAAADYPLPLEQNAKSSVLYVAEGSGNVMELGYYSDGGNWVAITDGSLEAGNQYKVEHGSDMKLIIKVGTYLAEGFVNVAKFS